MSGKKHPPKQSLELIRNLGVIAHIDAGKTTLTERILFYSDRIHRLGEVHEGTATMDFMPEEQERGITITAACTTCAWRGRQINLIDTPGHVDFTIEVQRSLRVLDGAVGVFCAVSGVEPQSETVWRQSEGYGVPKLAFINKMDRLGADFEGAIRAMVERLGARPVALQIPLGSGADFVGVADLLTMESLRFDPASQGREILRARLAGAELEAAAPWRDKLIEALAETDDALLENYMAGIEPPLEALRAALRRATVASNLIPVLCGSALKNIGVQPLMDAVCDYLPSPLDRPGAAGIDPQTKEKKIFPAAATAPLAALVFKVSMETGRKVAFVRLYSGRIEAGQEIFNVTQNQVERAARLFRLHADQRERLDVALAGDIVAVAGLRFARTGDTLALASDPILLERISAYQPVISLAVEPQNAQEAEKLSEVLEKFLVEDPTLFVEHDEATGQMILSGMGELHLEVILERMRREYGLAPRSGKPQVVYRETVTQEGEGVGEYHRELGDKFHYGFVRLAVIPRRRLAGRDIVFEIDSTSYPAAWLDAIDEGLSDGLQSGVVGGYPVEDVRLRVLELRALEKDSSPVGFRMAANMALKNALTAAAPKLLEPLMEVEITVPEDFLGDAVSLLGAKGAKIEDITSKAAIKAIRAKAALRKLFGFSTELRNATQGRAGLVMKFSCFDLL
jgi:elongation factor G